MSATDMSTWGQITQHGKPLLAESRQPKPDRFFPTAACRIPIALLLLAANGNRLPTAFNRD